MRGIGQVHRLGYQLVQIQKECSIQFHLQQRGFVGIHWMGFEILGNYRMVPGKRERLGSYRMVTGKLESLGSYRKVPGKKVRRGKNLKVPGKLELLRSYRKVPVKLERLGKSPMVLGQMESLGNYRKVLGELEHLGKSLKVPGKLERLGKSLMVLGIRGMSQQHLEQLGKNLLVPERLRIDQLVRSILGNSERLGILGNQGMIQKNLEHLEKRLGMIRMVLGCRQEMNRVQLDCLEKLLVGLDIDQLVLAVLWVRMMEIQNQTVHLENHPVHPVHSLHRLLTDYPDWDTCSHFVPVKLKKYILVT